MRTGTKFEGRIGPPTLAEVHCPSLPKQLVTKCVHITRLNKHENTMTQDEQICKSLWPFIEGTLIKTKLSE